MVATTCGVIRLTYEVFLDFTHAADAVLYQSLAPSLLIIGEAFAAIGYTCMWKSWSGHPHLNAEPAQGQGYETSSNPYSLIKTPKVM